MAVAPNLKEPHLILKSKDKALVGSTGVNQVVGSYELPAGGAGGAGGAAITLRPGGITQMAGPEAMMKQEQRLLERLRRVDGYRLAGEQLTFSAQGRDVMVLRAVYLK